MLSKLVSKMAENFRTSHNNTINWVGKQQKLEVLVKTHKLFD